MGDITPRQKGLLESYKKGFDKIKNLPFKTLTEDKTIKYTLNKEERIINLSSGFVVLDCDDVLLTNWLKLIDMVDIEYSKNENGDFARGLDKFLN